MTAWVSAALGSASSCRNVSRRTASSAAADVAVVAAIVATYRRSGAVRSRCSDSATLAPGPSSDANAAVTASTLGAVGVANTSDCVTVYP